MENDINIFRQATEKEIDFYMNSIYPLQDRVLENIKNDAFYLTGGTALSRFHYRHRFFDDLDFFYDGYIHPKENFNISFREIVYNLEKVFPGVDEIEVTIDGEFYKRLFVKQDNVSLKIEFVYENFKTVGARQKLNDFWVDSKENICANKIGPILDRRTGKDYIDLYFLLNDVDFAQAVKWSEFKKVPTDNEDFIKFTRRIIGDLIHAAKNR
jgi:predicted nucleotidyltransferase component of viral defense system